MTTFRQVRLEDRGLITVGGPDRRAFLQGLISNDVERAGPERAIWAALLTAQGKYLHDFFIVELDSVLYLDCEAERLMDLGQRLSRFKLRAKIDLGIAEDYGVWVAYGSDALPRAGLSADPGHAVGRAGGTLYCDPRVPAIGLRAILPKSSAASVWRDLGAEPGDRQEYDRKRMRLGLPDGSRDMVVEKSILLENNFDSLHGVDWNKGCYVGQELTARTKYRGLIKKRLMPVEIDGGTPEAGTPVVFDGRDAGEMRSAAGNVGLALLRLEPMEEALAEGRPLTADGAHIVPRRPDWDVTSC